MNGKEDHSYTFNSFRLDLGERQLLNNDEPVPLTPKAFEVLARLVKSSGHLVEKDELMRSVWPDSFVEEANISRIVHTLRRALGEEVSGQKYIETVAKRGYRFVASVEIVRNESSAARLSPATPQNVLPVVADTVTGTSFIGALVDGNTDAGINERRTETDRTPYRRVFIVGLSLIVIVAILGWSMFQLRSAGRVNRLISKLGLSRLTSYGNVGKVSLSPEGNLIAFEVDDKDGVSLFVRQIETSNVINLVPPKKGIFTFLTFSPDGKLVYYGFFPGDKIAAELYSVPALGGSSRRLPTLTTSSMSFAPDGKDFAHVTTDSGAGETILMISNIERDARPVELLKRKAPDSLSVLGQPCAWSPDGKTIAVIGSVSEGDERFFTLIGVGPTDGAERSLSAKRWKSLEAVQWMRDQSGILVVGSDMPRGPNQVWFVSAIDGEVRVLTNDLNDYSYLALSADGKQMVAVQETRTSAIWLGVPGQDQNNFKKVVSETGQLDMIAPMPNGDLIFRSIADRRSSLSTIRADGSGRRLVTFDVDVDERGMCVTPDGKQAIFPMHRSGKVNLWRVAIDTGEVTQLTGGDVDVYPVCTPDGASVIYQKGFGFGVRSTLWKVAIDGSEPTRLTDYFAMRPAVSIDGKRVVFFYMTDDKWSFGVASADGGPIDKSIDVPDGVPDRLAHWSTDGRSVLYAANTGEAGNIWQLPLDGRRPQPVTNFASQEIEDFFLANSGKLMGVTRTSATSDVVAMKWEQ